MKKKKVKTKKSLLRVIVEILLVITIILYLSAFFRIRENSRGYIYDYSARDYVYDTEANRFGRVLYTATEDMARGATYDNDEEEFRALGFYFEQAVLEKAYREEGKLEEAEAFKAKKEEYLDKMGSLSSKAAIVEEMLDKFDSK